MKIGVYVCHCGTNIAANIDVVKVVGYAATLPYVVVSRDYQYMCSDPGQELIKKDIYEHKLDRIVVASCSPAMHEPTFQKVLEEAGLNRYCLEMVNIREQCSWVHMNREEATRKTMVLVAGAAARAALLWPLTAREVNVTPTALVIGGGISGIQTALDIADNGFRVYLVEKEPSIGGRMAQLDKTFPTLDCSACILTPKMVDVSRHPLIELMTYAEVVDVQGYVGNFKVKVKKKPRYIDTAKCTGCGLCAEACILRGKILNEFDVGTSKRSAVYLPFPQAVPLKYTVDKDNCMFIRYGVCGKYPACKKVCSSEAIDFNQKEEFVELNVGAIVVAAGYDVFDPKIKPELGYGLYRNVITGLELERLCSASGPTHGKIKVDGKEPRAVLFIHCVGSRDAQVGNEYCSRVCCMYTAKHAYLIKEKLPNTKVTVCYIDMRASGKGYEEFYKKVQLEGVQYRRVNVAEVYQKGEKLVARGEDTLLGEPCEIESDLIVLAVGLTPKKNAKDTSVLLRIPQGSDGFFLEVHPKLRPLETTSSGVFLAGCCQGPKDIPESVAQASGAASKAVMLLSKGKVLVEPFTPQISEDICTGCGFCIEVCPYEAISFKDVNRYGYSVKAASVNEALCKGCGACSAACLSGAIQQNAFTDEQLLTVVKMLSGDT